MPIKYHIEDCAYRFTARRVVGAWVRDCIVREGKLPGEINYIFCSDAYLLEMNRQFLGHDYFTDVITFQYEGGGEAPASDEFVPRGTNHAERVSGDVFISVDTVAANAREFGQPARHEMLRVMIHGALHLCGYKDKTLGEETLMREKENFYLGLLPEGIL